ncbi:MAG: hypothetical protein UY54_C0019G0005 [Parcubacteria group bacterium GW2011_GWA2_50_10b]|nr:MAG: hypothetical protein UY54_C0019G0005 [Parcubacteria group bacterium GW2011_GWA2_50_10b]
MDEEFFQQDIFGNTVKVVLENPEDEDAIGPKARGDFNVFTLTDAIGARHKRDAWVLYRKALASGMAAEEVFFKVFWQVKTMMVASKTKTAEEAEMKPFPYSKAKGFLKNFSQEELQNLSAELVAGYHQARRGEGEIETLVEKQLLKL